MKIVIPGGSGQLGALLCRAFQSQGHDVVVFSRAKMAAGPVIGWDGVTLGPWAKEIDGADVVINLTGRSVNCRYTQQILDQMMQSRIDSTRIIGLAIAASRRPPRLWLQMSTATIYAHTWDAANDETSGVIGGLEPDAPKYWGYSVEIAKAWEHELATAAVPGTRKVALRTAMVMTPHRGGIFDVLLGLARKGLGGVAGNGRQYVSWIHGEDFVRSIQFLIAHEEISGAVNLASPGPLPQREFAALLREAAGIGFGLPAMKWMLEIGAFFLRTDTELVLKSRRVVPGLLLAKGLRFAYPGWKEASRDLIGKTNAGNYAPGHNSHLR